MSRTTLLVCAALLSTLLVPPAAAEPGAGAVAGAVGGERSVSIRGHGYGHGRGLSQYGAQKAAREGRGHREILDFYYPRTGLGEAGGQIRILLTGDTGEDLVVRDRAGLTVRSLGSGRTWRLREPAATQWRITPDGQGDSVVSYRARRWRVWRTVPGTAEFGAEGSPLALVAEAGTVRYRGALRSAGSGDRRDTVNVLGLEAYLRGVVPQEVPALWEPAAVRAQAVAARTYAAFERRTTSRPAYDLCDTTSCQVYGGASAEHPASDAAIRATRRQVVTRQGEPIFAQFNASSGGWTVDGPFPYLAAQRDPWDDWRGNPYHSWHTTVAAATIEEQWPAVGRLTRISVLERDGHGEWNGRILRMRLVGTAGRVAVSGDDFRSRLGLRSTWLRIRADL